MSAPRARISLFVIGAGIGGIGGGIIGYLHGKWIRESNHRIYDNSSPNPSLDHKPFRYTPYCDDSLYKYVRKL